MKKLIFLMLSLMIFAPNFALAVKMEINQDGQLRKADTNWRELSKIEQQAFDHPWIDQPIYDTISWHKDGWFHLKTVKTYQQVLVFNPEKNKLTTINISGQKTSQRYFRWDIVLSLLVLSLMTTAKLWRKMTKETLVTKFWSKFLIVTNFLAAMTLCIIRLLALRLVDNIFTTIVAMISVLTVLSLVPFLEENLKSKEYKIYNSIFYTLATLQLILLILL